MRRFCVALLFIIGIVFAAASAMAANSVPLPYSALEKWVGQYPSVDQRTMKPYPAGQSFWDDPVVARALADAVPQGILKRAKSCWGEACAEKRIEKQDRFLVVYVCKRSLCTSNSLRVYFSMENGFAQGCAQTTKTMFGHQMDIWLNATSGKTKIHDYPGPNACTRFQGVLGIKKFGVYALPQSIAKSSAAEGRAKK